ncbi:Piso0_001776 [Millerozyma farinosa CBS 7064]|uniref:Piso0_001776 protein n=1 Tax=Pichia sorbitophila (strain ATCC MYA-4447 / BCRC 22081 / CBS 7064 / NBRC 10061 / NRRL Y-12695) TaxID=559304 RepID=G8YP24_PICSO|nr:Piso0_001776 [Millerozyma farinosa CBS 7064]
MMSNGLSVVVLNFTYNNGGTMNSKDKTTRNNTICCPFCSKPEYAENHDLICENCNGEKLELLLNTCAENDLLNNLSKGRIDEIFISFFDVLETGDSSCINLSQLENGEVPNPSKGSIKALILQLLKLEHMEKNLAVKSIDKTNGVIEKRIDDLKSNIDSLNHSLEEKRTKMDRNLTRLIEDHQNASKDIETLIKEYRYDKMSHTQRKTLDIQYNNYKLLVDFVFRRSSVKKKSLSYISNLNGSRGSSLLFYNQNIIRLEHFLSYNGKLSQINEFLENLVRLQCHLQEIFKDVLNLPYINELSQYLPDSKYFDYLREREEIMMYGVHPSEMEDEAPNEPQKDFKFESDQIIKLGSTIKLPLSSKTINNQLRRASMVKASDIPRESLQEDTKADSSSPGTTTGINKSAVGKRMVLMPHKILYKPISKLNPKEYLKFLSIIVKILVNFRSFFLFTSQCELNKSNVEKSMTFKLYDPNDMESYNFEAILEKISDLDSFFKCKHEQIITSPSYQILEGDDSNGSSRTHSSVGTASHASVPASISDASQDSNFFLVSGNSGSSFHDSKSKSDIAGSRIRNKDYDIYGNISETKDRNDVTNEDTEPFCFPQLELKLLMQNTYKIMASGIQNSRNFSSKDKNKSVNINTINMMAQSKVQLEDWDVVSRMY